MMIKLGSSMKRENCRGKVLGLLASILAVGIVDWAATECQAQVVTLRVVNDTTDWRTRSVIFRIKSENSHNPNAPWVERRISTGKETKIELRSPDRFIYELVIGRKRFTSDPVALKKALANDPTAFLSLATLAAGEPARVPPVMIGASLQSGGGQFEANKLTDIEQTGLWQTFDSNRPIPEVLPVFLDDADKVGRPDRILLGIDCNKCADGIHINSVDAGGAASRSRDLDGNRYSIDADDHIVSVNGYAVRSFQHYLDLLGASPRTVQFGLLDDDTNRVVLLRTKLW